MATEQDGALHPTTASASGAAAVKPADALSHAISLGEFLTSAHGSRYRGRPGEVIERCPPGTREALRHLTSENAGTPPRDLMSYLCYDETREQVSHYKLEFDRKYPWVVVG